MKTMKLYHNNELMGTIENVGMEGLWMLGELTLNPAADKYKEMLDFLVDEERNHQNPPYPMEDLEGWSIEYEEGMMRDVLGPPAVHDNYTNIAWRW